MASDSRPLQPLRTPAHARGSLASGVGSDRLLVILSDVEMGCGGVTDDFPHSDLLADLLLSYNEGPSADLAVDLVFNGDTFDLLKTPYQGKFPRHITGEVALGKMQLVSAAHPRFFDGVARFLDHRRAERRVHFIAGNHDPELLFPEVQEFIRARSGGDPRIAFPGLSLDIGKVHVEHGAQLDPLFRMNEHELIVDFAGEPILNISWGAAALLATAIPLKELLHFHDRVKPKEMLFDLVPEIRELLMERFWAYWLHDFWRGYFGVSDPTQGITWAMLKEVVWRFSSKNAEVQLSDEMSRRMVRSDDVALYVIGHRHQSQWTSFGDRKILESGCLRNEYMVLPGGELRPIAKCYVEALLRDGFPVVSRFVEFESPNPPEGYLPASIFEVVPQVRALLSSGTERDRARDARRDQERREAGHTTTDPE